MKNTGTDYFNQLRNDFIPKEKNHEDQYRRPFNPGDPNEFGFMTTVKQPVTDERNSTSFSAANAQSGNKMLS